MLLFEFLTVAAAQDIQSGKVSNRLIAAGLMAGAVFQVTEYGVVGVYHFLGNISFPVILLYLLFQMRVLGAGDIKLFSMIGGMLTIEELCRCMAYSFIAAGAGAVLFLAADKERAGRLRFAAGYLRDCLRTGQAKPYRPPFSSERYSFAFSVPVLFGVMLALFPACRG